HGSLPLFSVTFELLRAHQSREQYEQYLQPDPLLVGTLQLLACLVRHGLSQSETPLSDELSNLAVPDGEATPAAVVPSASSPTRSPVLHVLSYVYHECLFWTPAKDAVQGAKCKAYVSRLAAFGLLLE